jgi:hypothetical protein
MSVFVVRAFVRLRAMLAANRELADNDPAARRRSKIGFTLPSTRTG